MKMNSRGFLITEVVASFSVFVTIMLTVTPIFYQLTIEEHILKERRNIQSVLHDELQIVLATDFKTPIKKDINIDNQKVEVSFTEDSSLVKGCARWNNAKQVKEELCLYGYTKK
ncbi:hypothetical protein [Aquibacillus rhizosphaerae]|uniref:Type II secretion system protein n=1 Tax=Aquibacillus rhizosphaerae TaxID=3051431 RepID=A0ABT7L6R1_9BACI|nr:hypothetical protein [Aquibacillus sp. LR5S19]MDL4841556.1 hypothetical protein [Aquibacillus sp. LR5S19]